MENLPILYRNIMDGLPSDFARDVFLWASDRPGNDRHCYVAEKFARDAEMLVSTLVPLLHFSARQHGLDSPPPGLMGFILQRHANWRFGGNVRPRYVEAV